MMIKQKLKYVIRMLRELLPPNRLCRGASLINHAQMLRDIPLIRLNIKNMGYEVGRRLAAQLKAMPLPEAPGFHGLVSKPTTQADVESSWFVYWCSQIKAAPIYHRKLWEFAFLLQALHEHEMLHPGRRAIGFGCGEEPLASYFASCGIEAVVTDLDPERVAGLGWQETGQHTRSIEQAFHPAIVSREIFDRYVSHRYVDMNCLPSFDQSYDFCWSVCALEHLGSIAQGLDFIENSLAALKPGGIAVHTTEFNYLCDSHTTDNWVTVLFQRRHFEELAARLAAKGHQMLGPEFGIGNGFLDRFVDLPPYALGEDWLSQEQWQECNQAAHLKLMIDGYACTCYGIIVRKSAG